MKIPYPMHARSFSVAGLLFSVQSSMAQFRTLIRIDLLSQITTMLAYSVLGSRGYAAFGRAFCSAAESIFSMKIP